MGMLLYIVLSIQIYFGCIAAKSNEFHLPSYLLNKLPKSKLNLTELAIVDGIDFIRKLSKNIGPHVRYTISKPIKDYLFKERLPISARPGKDLKFVYMFSRHGSRSPIGDYPNNPYHINNTKYWPDGPGILTKVGKKQSYALGKWTRNHYNGFLPRSFSFSDTRITTNDYDRCFQTAYCYLAALYPPVTNYQLWNSNIPWQPITVRADNFDESEIVISIVNGVMAVFRLKLSDAALPWYKWYKVFTDPTSCPLFSSLMNEALAKLDSNSAQYSDLFKYLTLHTGEEITKIIETLTIFDNLYFDHQNGYKLPSWSKKVFPDTLCFLNGKIMSTMVAGTPEMLRLGAGPYLKDISGLLTIKANGTMTPDYKFCYNAAHDITVYFVLSALGLGDMLPCTIETTAAVTFELHQTGHEHTVELYYLRNGGATAHPERLTIPACGDPCPLSLFNDIVNKINPEDRTKECQLHNTGEGPAITEHE